MCLISMPCIAHAIISTSILVLSVYFFIMKGCRASNERMQARHSVRTKLNGKCLQQEVQPEWQRRPGSFFPSFAKVRRDCKQYSAREEEIATISPDSLVVRQSVVQSPVRAVDRRP